MSSEIIVIGSGLSGLLSGYLLSKEGFEVTLLEKNSKSGGSLQMFRRDIYTFDTGMHYIGSMAPGQTLYNYWKYFGLSGRLNLRKMDPDGFDRLSFGSGNVPGEQGEFPLAQGFENFRERLLPYFPGADAVLKKYTSELDEIAKAHPLYNLELPTDSHIDYFQSINASSFLSDLTSGIRHPASGIRLHDILTGNNFLYAGNPASTPLSQFGLINHSFISSAWRMNGGSQQIADILANGIHSQGGKVMVRKKVTRIGKKGEKFFITTADGDHFESDKVISDIHPAITLQLLKGIPVQKAYRERIGSLTNSVSVFTIYLGLKPGVFPFINHNTYHCSARNIWSGLPPMGDAWPDSFLFMTPPEPDQGIFASTAVIMASMRFDETKSWENSESGTRDKEYLIFKARRSKRLLDLAYEKFPELKEAIATIDISTPLTWRDYTGTQEGSMYGIMKDAVSAGKTVIFPKTKIPGLFLTGQNVNMHGAVGVTIGAVMTCGEIIGLPFVLKSIKRAL